MQTDVWRADSAASAMVRMMLAWLRIVGAGTVHATRRRSETWRSIDTAWRSRIACVHFDGALPLSYSPQMNWQREEAMVNARGVSSGAAAVLARRRGRGDGSGTPSDEAAGMRTAHDMRRKVARTVGAGAGTSAAHAAAASRSSAGDSRLAGQTAAHTQQDETPSCHGQKYTKLWRRKF